MHHRKPVARAAVATQQPTRGTILVLTAAGCAAFWIAVAAAVSRALGLSF